MYLPPLLKDLGKVANRLKADFERRCEAKPYLLAPFRKKYRDANGVWLESLPRDWLDTQLGECSGMWVFATAVTRFLESHGWIAPRLCGEAAVERRRFEREVNRGRLQDYLAYDVPPDSPLFGTFWRSWWNLRWLLAPDGEEAEALFVFWRGRSEDEPFIDPADTTAIGDLYGQFSVASRKNDALVQTPNFVGDFLLDHTLTLAVTEFGLDDFRLIDPCCGTGHVLCLTFRQLTALWERRALGLTHEGVARKALGSIHGVDINPFAVDLARWRLKTAALVYCGLAGRESYRRPPYWLDMVDRNVVWGDSLLPADHEFQPFRRRREGVHVQ